MLILERLRSLNGYKYNSDLRRTSSFYSMLRWMHRYDSLDSKIKEIYYKAQSKADLDYYLDDADWVNSLYTFMLNHEKSEQFTIDLAKVDRLLKFYCHSKGETELYISHSVIDNIVNHCLLEQKPILVSPKEKFWDKVSKHFRDISLGNFW